MAKVQVQIVVAKVTENGDYKGRVVDGWESFTITFKGEQFNKNRHWTMWLDLPSSLVKDDVVTFTGDLGTKAGGLFEKDGQTYQLVEHSLNQATFTVNSHAVPLPAAPVTELTENPPF